MSLPYLVQRVREAGDPDWSDESIRAAIVRQTGAHPIVGPEWLMERVIAGAVKHLTDCQETATHSDSQET